MPEEERAFGFPAQVPCQGVSPSDRISLARQSLARDVRLSDKPARRREWVGLISRIVRETLVVGAFRQR